MCPAETSTTTPSGNFRPSSTMVFKSEPSGFAENTRPPPKSRKNNRPEVLDLSARRSTGCKDFVLIHSPRNVVSDKRLEAYSCAIAQKFCQYCVFLFGELFDRAISRHAHYAVRNGPL